MGLKKEIKSVILAPLEARDERMIGVELEDFIYDKKIKRIPVNPGSKYSASDLLKNLIDLQVNDKYKAYYSIEPGGQIEWASTPRRSLHDVQIELNSHQKRLKHLLNTHQLEKINLSRIESTVSNPTQKAAGAISKPVGGLSAPRISKTCFLKRTCVNI